MNSFLRWFYIYTTAIVFIVGCSSENWRKSCSLHYPIATYIATESNIGSYGTDPCESLIIR